MALPRWTATAAPSTPATSTTTPASPSGPWSPPAGSAPGRASCPSPRPPRAAPTSLSLRPAAGQRRPRIDPTSTCRRPRSSGGGATTARRRPHRPRPAQAAAPHRPRPGGRDPWGPTTNDAMTRSEEELGSAPPSASGPGPAAHVPGHRPHRAGRPGAARSGCGSSARQAPTPPATPPPRAQRAPRPSRRWAGGRGAGGQSGSSPSAGPARPGHVTGQERVAEEVPKEPDRPRRRRPHQRAPPASPGHARPSLRWPGQEPCRLTGLLDSRQGTAQRRRINQSAALGHVEVTSSRPRRPVISPRSGRAAPRSARLAGPSRSATRQRRQRSPPSEHRQVGASERSCWPRWDPPEGPR